MPGTDTKPARGQPGNLHFLPHTGGPNMQLHTKAPLQGFKWVYMEDVEVWETHHRHGGDKSLFLTVRTYNTSASENPMSQQTTG